MTTTTKAKATAAPEVAQTDKPIAERDDKGRFPKGVSGNPAGRSKGTKNRITLERLLLEEALRGTLTKHGPKIMKKAIRMALAGNDKVMRVLLDKMLATPKGDDDGDARDREVTVLIQNLTSNQAKPVIQGNAIRIPIPPPEDSTDANGQ